MKLVAKDLHNANGLVLSNDGKTLYLVETEDTIAVGPAIACPHSTGWSFTPVGA